MWFLLKLFSLVVASLFMHNICKDKIDNYLLLSQQQSVYELPHVSDVAVVLNGESRLLIGHVLNISEALVTASLHHNSVYLPSNTSFGYLPLTDESYNHVNVYNQYYVPDVLIARVADEYSTQPIESNVYLPSTNYIDNLPLTNDNIFDDQCYVTDVITLRIDVEPSAQPIESNVYLPCNTSVDYLPFPTESFNNGNVSDNQYYVTDGEPSAQPIGSNFDIPSNPMGDYLSLTNESCNNDYVSDDQCYVTDDLASRVADEPGIQTFNTNYLLVKPDHNKTNIFEEETYDYIYQQLKSYLPLYIYKELVNEYHVLSMEYQQRQQNDLSKPSWKQTLNIRINKIKIFTRQTNSLQWKLLHHIVNCVKSITRSTIYYLNHLYILIVDYISPLFTLFKMIVQSIDFQLRDILCLNVFLLVIYETKKTNKRQMVHLTKHYEGEITSMELLLKNTNDAYKWEMNNMVNTKLKEKLRSAELVKEQQSKYDKLLKKMNNQLSPPFLHLPPPPPFFKHNLSRPTTYKLNACQPFINKPMSAVPKRLSTVRFNSTSTARQSVKPIVQLPLFAPIAQRQLIAPIIQPLLIVQRPPIVQRPQVATVQQDKIDSLQFFGCPTNYTRPTIRVN